MFHALARPEIAEQVENHTSHSHRGLAEVVPMAEDIDATPAAVKVCTVVL